MKRNIQDYMLLFIKGVATGAASVVPGLSGATVAVVTGTYDSIVESVSACRMSSLRVFLHSGIESFLGIFRAKFLLSVVAGSVTGFFLTFPMFNDIIKTYPVYIYSMMAGVVMASAFYASKKVIHWGTVNITAMILGVLLSTSVMFAHPINCQNMNLVAIVAGLVIGAGIFIPGVSLTYVFYLFATSSHLVLSYYHEPFVMVLFIMSTVGGAIIASRIIHCMFAYSKNITWSLLTGSTVGGLCYLWPWRDTTNIEGTGKTFLSYMIDSQFCFPFSASNISGQYHQLVLSAVFMICGSAIIVIIRKIIKL